ncbi:MAG: hypothetical protein IJJ61_03830 [Clostridia bacterium]|nr:hypothetical protein [Clostridia bacterium]
MDKYVRGYLDTVDDVLRNPLVISMKQYNHHAGISTHFHSVYVSYTVYKYCARRNMEKQLTDDITRASLLHDFYLYDWPTEKHEEYHIFYHPKEAVKNIEKTGIIKLNYMQKNMILNHMFPAAQMPRSLGGWILTAADKYCATRELVEGEKCFRAIYNDIDKEIDDAGTVL